MARSPLRSAIILAAGEVAYDDVSDRQLVTLKQELVMRPWGPERYGW